MDNLTWIIPVAVVGLLVLYLIGTYNGLVGRRNETKNAWSQIDVQLKRRYDLIPNLVETAKGYMKHERETLEAVVRARQVCVDLKNAENVGDRIKAEGALSQTLRSLFAVAESYPDLKANQNMLALQEELTSTENRIGFARQAYNDQVMEFNDRASQFPDLLWARLLGFMHLDMLQSTANAQERAMPQVRF